MEKTDKLYLIYAKLNEIRESTQTYRENENMYCHFNKVLEHLDAALEEMREHPHWKRPDNLPDDMIWSDACNPDDQSDSFAYRGDMPAEDFVRMQEEYFANEGNEVLDAEDFRGEAKAEEEFENDEENKSAAGFDGCDADGVHGGDGECKRACTYQDCDAERFRVCADHEEQKACSIIQNRQQHEN